MNEDAKGLRERLSTQGEQALGKLAQDLLENPLVSGALTRAFDARERAVQAQEAAMGALNLPSAADIERLTRRLRSVAQRLEGIEDSLDRLDRRLEHSAGAGGDDDLAARVAELTDEVRKLAAKPAPKPKPKSKPKA
jgi:CRP-like cAMP-binding protein